MLALLLLRRYLPFTLTCFSPKLLWEYSYLLESVAILPQLLIIRRVGKAETITANYLVLLGLYRAFYILSWITRIVFLGKSVAPQILISGIWQTLLYIDVFYLYFVKCVCVVLFCPPVSNYIAFSLNRVVKGKKFTLPS